MVWIRRRRWRIEDARLDHDVVRLDVLDRSRRLTFLVPFDRPTAVVRPIPPHVVRPAHALARLAGLAATAGGVRTPISGVTSDIALHPHQFEPVLAVLSGARRVLVADEVGLGKTIQAGLVLAELIARTPSIRALAIVPAALRTQWARELDARFHIHTMPVDRHAFDIQRRTAWQDDNPWLRPGVFIASLDFLKQRHALDALPLVPWDVVVVDEAHDASGHTDRHDACEAILRRARHVLLLTATPHSGDPTRFHRLVHLGALPGIPDDLTVFRRTRASLGWPAHRHIRWTAVRLSPPEARVLDALIAFEHQVLQSAGANRNAALLLLSVFRKRALSTMAALDRSLERRLDWLRTANSHDAPRWAQPRLAFDDEADVVDEDDRMGLTVSIGLIPDRERAWLGRLRLLTQAAIAHDSKVAWLTRLIARASEPVVIFTEFRDSLAVVCRRLSPSRALARLHGGQSAAERAAELDRFLGGSASILAATDVAGQGLNLQGRARWVVSLELPWTPARIEQRVGRVDRIGQARLVHATLLVARHDAEAGLLTRLATRALTARGAFTGNALDAVAPPAQLSVAAGLLAGAAEPQPEPSPTNVPLCVRWTMRGQAVARLLERKRRLASHWRADVDIARRPARTTLRRTARLAGIGRRAFAIVYAPLLNRDGAVMEPHYLAVAVESGEPSRLDHPDVRAHLDALARARLQKRLERVRRLLAESALTRTLVEQAIAADLRAVAAQTSAQPELFVGRSLRASTASRRQAEAITRDIEDRLRAFRHDQDLSIGPPTLVMFVRLPR